MVGDFVVAGGKPRRITGLDATTVYFGEDCEDAFKVERISPIPLETGFFIKNGFARSKSGRSWQLRFSLPYGSAFISWCLWGRISVSYDKSPGNRFNGDCTFVHDFQHALKQCNVEIPIVL